MSSSSDSGPTATDPEGVWIRYCEPCKWLSPTFYRYADLLASFAEHNKGNGRCFPRTIGRLEYGTAAAVVAARLPEWAREAYWGSVADRYFTGQESADV